MVRFASLAAGASVLLLLAGPLGTRMGLWSFVIGFLMLAASMLAAMAAVVSGVLAALRTGAWLPAGAAIVVGVAVLVIPLRVFLSGRGAPPIHDISTDLSDPPPFVAILPLRAGAANPPAHGGAEIAASQRRAFSDIQPLELNLSPSQAFDRALAIVGDRGWELVASDAASGRIEAVDTTFWFGFKDDVVVRVRPTASGSRVDVRSKSRVGVGDLGTNARRVRALLASLRGDS